jgi:uncharacterized membrane protein YebE (DUF533 family)
MASDPHSVPNPIPPLGKDVFLALAAIGWSDGNLDRDEADAIARAALESGLSIEEVSAIDAATKAPVTLDLFSKSKLAPLERLFVYATAVWLARLDGHVDPGERRALHVLGDKLGLGDRARTHASAAALEVAQMPSGDRPDRYDFLRLRERLVARLRELVGVSDD